MAKTSYPRRLSPIEVRAHSGYKANEEPRALVLGGREVRVERLLERWYDEEASGRDTKTMFRISIEGGAVLTVALEERTGEWFLLVESEEKDEIG